MKIIYDIRLVWQTIEAPNWHYNKTYCSLYLLIIQRKSTANILSHFSGTQKQGDTEKSQIETLLSNG